MAKTDDERPEERDQREQEEREQRKIRRRPPDKAAPLPPAVLRQLWGWGIPGGFEYGPSPEKFAAVLHDFGPLPEDGQLQLAEWLAAVARAHFRRKLQPKFFLSPAKSRPTSSKSARRPSAFSTLSRTRRASRTVV